jgi:hypothetical protein
MQTKDVENKYIWKVETGRRSLTSLFFLVNFYFLFSEFET